MAHSPVSGSVVRLPCYDGFTQFAIWPSPQLVSLEEINQYIFCSISRAFPATDFWMLVQSCPQYQLVNGLMYISILAILMQLTEQQRIAK